MTIVGEARMIAAFRARAARGWVLRKLYGAKGTRLRESRGALAPGAGRAALWLGRFAVVRSGKRPATEVLKESLLPFCSRVLSAMRPPGSPALAILRTGKLKSEPRSVRSCARRREALDGPDAAVGNSALRASTQDENWLIDIAIS